MTLQESLQWDMRLTLLREYPRYLRLHGLEFILPLRIILQYLGHPNPLRLELCGQQLELLFGFHQDTHFGGYTINQIPTLIPFNEVTIIGLLGRLLEAV